MGMERQLLCAKAIMAKYEGKMVCVWLVMNPVGGETSKR